MSSVVTRTVKLGIGHPPKWLPGSVAYETIMGSVAYGVSSDTSDMDIYGFAIPPKDEVFPHLRGEIIGFGRQKHCFAQWQEHHMEDKEKRKVYDVSIYSIVKYFQLCMENNPNMIDSLFTPRRCVTYSTEVGEHVRENRKLFLHKGAWFKFKGYAYAQMHKIEGGQNRSNPKRAESIAKFGYDVKFGYHVVRLVSEIEQIMIEHDLDLERNREQLKAVRRGEWSLPYLKEWFGEKERALEGVYASSTLRHSPDEAPIKAVLLHCLEHHYGSIADAVRASATINQLGADIRALLDRHGA